MCSISLWNDNSASLTNCLRQSSHLNDEPGEAEDCVFPFPVACIILTTGLTDLSFAVKNKQCVLRLENIVRMSVFGLQRATA